MTYLKGQGLPERLMQYANGLRKVREYLEERERRFMQPDCPLDVDQETRIILRMYEAVRQKAEDSYSREAGPADPKKDLKAQVAANSDLIPPIYESEVGAPGADDSNQKKGLVATAESKRPQRNGTTTEEADGKLEEGEGEEGKGGSSKSWVNWQLVFLRTVETLERMDVGLSSWWRKKLGFGKRVDKARSVGSW